MVEVIVIVDNYIKVNFVKSLELQIVKKTRKSIRKGLEG